MIRFPNPGSNINLFITIFKELYQELNEYSSFSLDDISETLTSANLAASCGFVGEKALIKSTRSDRTRDPLYNQSKMYAELFRSLGWFASTESSALNYTFTYLGEHVANSGSNAVKLFEESILGINYPNRVINTQFTESSRIFATILHVAKKLDGYICRDELIVGPLSRDDDNVDKIAQKIRDIRPEFSYLSESLDELANELGTQVNTLHNYTRFPISVLTYCGWFEKVNTSVCYRGKKLLMLKLTEAGYAKERELSSCLDIRIDDFTRYSKEKQDAAIRLGFYSMLERANYATSEFRNTIEADRKCLNLGTRYAAVIFSPYQTIEKRRVDSALNVSKSVKNEVPLKSPKHIIAESEIGYQKPLVTRINCQDYTEPTYSNLESLEIYRKIKAISNSVIPRLGCSKLFEEYRHAKKEVFYPLIADLFTILGFRCVPLRNGINYERWDALIEDKERSIPIEIKSPTEEEYISIKAIRQALENKIVLLSRQTHKTTWDVTSLVVGYNLPNERAEVMNLIQDIRKTYGIKIGIIDFHSLLLMAILSVRNEKSIKRSEIEAIEGFIEVKYA